VPPPQTVPSGFEGNAAIFDFERLRVRVPAVLISPYIARGTVLHDEFEHSSLAATARAILAPGMEPLTFRDANANSFAHVLPLDAARDTPKKIDMKVDAADLRHTD